MTDSGALAAEPATGIDAHHGGSDIGGGDRVPWRSALTALAALPNVTVKLSGLLTRAHEQWRAADIQPYADVLLEAFGAGRLMFGSDWPVSTLRASYGEVVEVTERLLAGCTSVERAAVYAGTAAGWYRLDPAGSAP